MSCEISTVNWPYKLSCRYGTERYRWQRVKTNILGEGVLRDIYSKLARQILPVDNAQREIVGSLLRFIF